MNEVMENTNLFGIHGTIGRKAYLMNFLEALALLLFSALYIEWVPLWLETSAPSLGSGGAPLLIRAGLTFLVLLPAPLGALLSLWALIANTTKRLRDISPTRQGSYAWLSLLLIPVIGLGVQAVLFMKPGHSSNASDSN